MSPAHSEDNHLPPSSSSFSTLGVRTNNGLVTGQPEPGDTSGRDMRSEKEATELQTECGCQRRRRAEGRERTPTPPPHPICQPLWSTHHFQTQTYTPVMECKYLNMGKVGCFFLPSKMCCLVENGPKKTTRESLYFDFSKLTEQRAALSIYQSPLRVTE